MAAATSGTLGNLNGCLSFTPSGDQEFLVLAPYESRISASGTQVDMPGYPPLPFDEQVELDGITHQIYRASGPAKPAEWNACVGDDPDAAPMMFVVGPP